VEGRRMRKSISVLVLLSLFSLVLPTFYVSLVKAVEDSWTTLAPLPEPSSTIGAAVVDGKIYRIGWPTCEKYDPETNNWTTIASVPISPGGGSVVACQNKIYLMAGSNEYPTQVYDPVTNTWENRTSIPTKSARISLQANVVDGKIYMIGGRMLAGLYQIFPSSSNDVYDPETDSWSQMAPIPVPVMGYASAVLDDKIYIISGAHEGQPNYPPPTDLVQIFDPATNLWTNGTSIPNGVLYAGAVATTGLFAPKRIYVIGGTTTTYDRWAYYNVIALNQVYDPETDTWTTGTPMLTPRCDFGIAAVNDEIYAIGGVKEENYQMIVNEKYTPYGYIPEFSSWTLLLISLVAVVIVTVIYRRKLSKSNQRRVDQ
jgi:N-acetylneuraminic acid mutarotase